MLKRKRFTFTLHSSFANFESKQNVKERKLLWNSNKKEMKRKYYDVFYKVYMKMKITFNIRNAME